MLSPALREAARAVAAQAPALSDEQVELLRLILDPALRQAVELAEAEPAGELHWAEI